MDYLAKTLKKSVVANYPPCHDPKRVERRRNIARTLRQERPRRIPSGEYNAISYSESDSEDEWLAQENEISNTSYNFDEYLRSRESNLKEKRSVNMEYASRFIITHEMLRESPISLDQSLDKVFCSKWLSTKQVIFGTRCNKLQIYDVNTRIIDAIPTLSNTKRLDQTEGNGGLYAIEINPNRNLLATSASNSSDLAVYRLPTLDPLCIGSGENGHKDKIFDMCWLNDQYLVTGSKDSKLAVWRIDEDFMTSSDEDKLRPGYAIINPVSIKYCYKSQRVRGVCFNKDLNEIAAISSNGFIHIYCANNLRHKLTKKLPTTNDNFIIKIMYSSAGVYVIGSRAYALLLDTRTLQPIQKIVARYRFCGIRSASFEQNILTIGTGLGMILFYDLRAGKFLESSVYGSQAFLRASKGIVRTDCFNEDVEYFSSIFTHCYDSSGMRIFAAGGPLLKTIQGNYAAIWQ